MIYKSRDELKPAFSASNIAVCLSSSDEYSAFAGIVIHSIAVNSSPDYGYDIVVLTTDMSANNMELISQSVRKYPNISVRFFDIGEIVSGMTFYTWAEFSVYTYFRLLIPDLFVNYKKVLYLDSDIIVNHDIAELYKTDISGFLLAAARDTHVIGSLQDTERKQQQFDYYMNVIGVTDLSSYFQCGVSLYNITEFRSSFAQGELISMAESKKLLWLDQDLMNIVARGRILPLDNRWNVMAINNPDYVDEEHLRPEFYDSYWDARRDPYIVHFVGKSMPCFMESPDFGSLYWQYARTSLFYERLLLLMYRSENARLKKENSLKAKVKKKIVMPVVNVLFPPFSERRKKLKKIYFKLRGWDCDAF